LEPTGTVVVNANGAVLYAWYGAAEGAKITSVRFQFFQTDQEVDLSTLPAGLRGGLSGSGTITFDVTIGKRGEMNKAQVEQLCEQLPDFRSAQYSARLEILRANRLG
jgi:hypothetical protein